MNPKFGFKLKNKKKIVQHKCQVRVLVGVEHIPTELFFMNKTENHNGQQIPI